MRRVKWKAWSSINFKLILKLIKRKYLYKYIQMRHREKNTIVVVVIIIIIIKNNFDNKNDKIR